MRFVKNQVMVPNEMLCTQWSQMLGQEDFGVRMEQARIASGWAEKGDLKLLDEMAGRAVTIWAPSDHNALTRFFAAFIKRPKEQLLTILCMIVPVQVYPGTDII